MHLNNWKAKRAGGRITVYGTDETGNSAKIVGVDEIVPGVNSCVAVDKDGNRHVLAIG